MSTANFLLPNSIFALVFTLAVAPALASPTATKAILDQEKVAKQKVKLVSSSDRFSGDTFIYPAKSKFIGGTGVINTISWNIVHMDSQDGSDGYHAHIVYEGTGWLFLTGEIVVLVDGTHRHRLIGTDSSNNREVQYCPGGHLGCIVEESIRVPLEAPLMDQLAQANSIELRINGKSHAIEGYLTPYHQAGVRKLLEHIAALSR